MIAATKKEQKDSVIRTCWNKAAALENAIFSGGGCLDGLNRYTYCHNNPVKYIDPTGHNDVAATLTTVWVPALLEPTFIGEIVATVVTVAVLAEAATDTKQRETAYRYVSEGEAAVIMATGIVPNTDADGNPKLVFLTYSDCETIEEAERTLLIGDLNPAGPTSPPMYKVTVDITDTNYVYGGNITGGSPAIEIVTNEPVPAVSIEPLATENSNDLAEPGTVICTELYRQGLMEPLIYQADAEFGKYLDQTSPNVMIGYHILARPIVNAMKRSKSFTKVVNYFAKPWSYEMAYRVGRKSNGNIEGRIIMFIGLPLCSFIGNIAIGDTDTYITLFSIIIILAILIILKIKISGGHNNNHQIKRKKA